MVHNVCHGPVNVTWWARARGGQGYWGGFPPVDAGQLGLPDGAYLDKLAHDRQMKLLKGPSRAHGGNRRAIFATMHMTAHKDRVV